MRTITTLILATVIGLNGVCVNVVWGAEVDRDPPISNDGGSRFHQPPEGVSSQKSEGRSQK